MGAVVGGGLYWRSDFGPSPGDADNTRCAGSSLGGDDNPARTGVVAAGVHGPGEESSLLSPSSCDCPLSDARSSSSSNTGSGVCGTSSECNNEVWDGLSDLLTESESVLEKSHESMVLWNVDERRLRRS